MTGSVPSEFEEELSSLTAEQLDQVAQRAEQLAEEKRRQQRIGDHEKDGAVERSDDMPEDVPAKASLTKKTINDNQYYYWQWREGDKIRSKYKEPVSPKR